MLISCEVHCNYFHELNDLGVNVLFPLYALSPATESECRMHMHEFWLAGFNGAIGSTGATHVAIEKCSYRLRNNHLRAKQHLTARGLT
jgi:hypothetical protein